MAIAFRSLTSLSYASRTNTVLTAPAGLADGDILVAIIVTAANGGAPTPTPPAGFAAFGTNTSVTAPGGFNAQLRIFWKRAASESGSYTFTHTSCSSQGVLKAYSGCLTTGTPLAATSNNTGIDNLASGTSITTTAANSYLLYEAHDWTASGTLTPPTGMTERFDNLVYSADQLIVSAGATGSRAQTNGNASSGATDMWAVRMVELLVAADESNVREVDTGAGDWRETEAGVVRTTEGSVFVPPDDIDAIAWVAAVVANGGTVSAARQTLVSNFIVAEKAAGTWALTDDYWALWAENAIQALTSIKQRRLATAVTSPTFTADRGYAFNGTTSYLNTGFIPSTHKVALTGTNMRLASYERTHVSSGTVNAGTYSSATALLWLGPFSTSVTLVRANSSANATYTVPGADSRGWTAVSLNGTTFATDHKCYKAGAALTYAGGALTVTSGIPSHALYVGGTNVTGTLTYPRASSVGFVAIGAALSAAQETAQYDNVEAWAVAVGAATIAKAVAETAAALETLGGTLTYTTAVAETAAAADTVGGLPIKVGAVAETAAAADTVTGLLVRTAAVVEAAAAADTVGGLLTRIGAVAETVVAAETITKTITVTKAVAETAGAAETTTGLPVKTGAIAETAAAADTVGGLLTRVGAVAEAGAAAETITKSISVTRTVAETAAAADTVAALLVGVAAIDESTGVGRLTEAGDWRVIEDGSLRGTAGTSDTVDSLLLGVAAIAETAAAVETITYSLTGAAGTTYNELQLETATAVDTVGGLRVGTAAVIETAAAVETINKSLIFTRAIAETATAADTVGGLLVVAGVIAETTTESSGRQTEAGDWRETEDGKVRIATGVGDTVNGFLAAITVDVAESAAGSVARLTEAGDWRETEDGKTRASEGGVDIVGGFLTSTVAVAESTTASFGRLTEDGDWRETEDGRVRIAGGIGDTVDGLLTLTVAVAESASAAETVTAALVYTKAIVETAVAVETINKSLTFTRVIAETTAAADTINGLTTGTAAVAESASAAETITYSHTGAGGTTHNVTRLETAAAVETVAGLMVRTVAVAEIAAAVETVVGVRVAAGAVAIVESASAVDTVTSTVTLGENFLKVWTGSAWVSKPTKVWAGSSWTTKPVKVWDGSTWVGA